MSRTTFAVPQIGFSRQWTLAQLTALSNSDSAGFGMVWCSDCITSNLNAQYGFGDYVTWNPRRNQWITLADSVVATTDFLVYTLEICRRNNGALTSPFMTTTGETSQNVSGLTGWVTGGALLDSLSSNPEPMTTRNMQVTALNSAARAVPFFRSNASFGTAQQRAIGTVLSRVSNSAANSTATDQWQWRVGIETYQTTAVANLQADMVSLVMDDYNSLGLGINNSNLWAVVRASSTLISAVDTGIAATGHGFMIATWEPLGAAAGYGRARVATAGNYGASLVTHVNELVTLSGTSQLQPAHCGVKNLGVATRVANRKWFRGVTFTTTDTAGTQSVS